jgi:AAA domain
MTITFKPAIREQIALIIGLAGGTGSGKTKTAFRLAEGLSGGKRFAVIDTEAGRAKHYADEHKFDHAELSEPFRPEAYEEAIRQAEAANYPVIVVDSFSHEWVGYGGVLDWQEEELDRMAKDDYQKREACKYSSWIKPKTAHKKMVQRLLQVRSHLIICLRAEEKSDMVKGSDGRWRMEPMKTPIGLDGWVPLCDKKFPFELTMSLLLRADHPGVPHPIKLEGHHKPLFDLSKPIDEKTGARLAAWAAGSKQSNGAPTGPTPAEIEAAVQSYGACGTGDAESFAEL